MQSPNLFSLEKPIHDLFELNIKTLKNISYISPTNLLTTKNPEDLLEKNVGTFVQNSHELLNYFHDVCMIWNKYWSIFSYDAFAQNQRTLQNESLYDLKKVIQDSRDVTKWIGDGTEKAARKQF
jgi:hypothetical protein